MTDRELAAQTEAHLRRTTISYPDWQRRVAAGKYTPKDGSGTEWGKAFASLAQIGVEEPPPPPDPTEPPEYRHTYTGAQATGPDYGWDWGMQYGSNPTANFQIVSNGITAGLPSARITVNQASGGNSIEGLKRWPVQFYRRFYGQMIKFPTNWQEPSPEAWGAAINQLGYQALANNTLGLLAHANNCQFIILSGEHTWPNPSQPGIGNPIREYNNSTELGAWPNGPRAIPEGRMTLGVWHQLIFDVGWSTMATTSRLYTSGSPVGHVRVYHRIMGEPNWVMTIERTNIPTLQWGYGYNFGNGAPYMSVDGKSQSGVQYVACHKFGLYAGGASFARVHEHGNIVVGVSFGSVAGVMPN